MSDVSVKRFMALFKGNARSYGQWDPAKPKEKSSITIKEPYSDEQFIEHLEGRLGLGIVPIRDDGLCHWGAIDIDNHGQDKDIDIRAVEKRVNDAGLPFIPCRSKSGGVHLYIFFSEPVRADIVRTVLGRWAKSLDIDGTDCIYPKQGKLTRNAEGGQALGNWINLPYYDGAGGRSVRYAVSNGKRLSLDAFLSTAESAALDTAALNRHFADDLSQLPPCLQARLKSGGFASGERNDGVFQVAVFCRKRDPDTARDAAHDLSQRFMVDDPIPFRERDKTIRSAVSGRANYKCSNFKDVCDREACRKLKWGISESEYEALSSRAGMPSFTGLTKYVNADPVRFDVELEQEGQKRKIEGLEIEALSSFNELRKAVMEKTHIVLPRLKNDEWDGILRELFAAVKLEELPEDATPNGAVRARLFEFLRKADLKSQGDNQKDRENLMRGMPVVQYLDKAEGRVVMFRSVDFVTYLQRMKTDVIRNKDLWFRMNGAMGVENTKIRVGKSVIPIWYFPLDLIEQDEQHAAQFQPEY